MAAYVLRCDGCGNPFTASRSHARTCSHACRQRVHVRRRERDEDLIRLGDTARSLVIAGALHPLDALALVVCPSDRIRRALADRRVA